jgi:GNAT superfamily N-acetyltransferase
MYEIRPAREEDELFAHRLTRSNMEAYVARYWGGWDEDIFARNYRLRENLILWTDDNPIGYVALTWSEACVRIEDLQIQAAYQRQGIGTWILGSIERLAVERNVSNLEVRVFHDNPAGRLYRRLGFTSHARDENTETLRKMAEPASAPYSEPAARSPQG